MEMRVSIARDMIAQGSANIDIYRATKEQTGYPIGTNALANIRAGKFHGWGAHLLQPKTVHTSDVPPARVHVPAEKVIQGVTLQQALRLVSAAMREEKIAKLCVYEDGRVKASVHRTSEWTID
ncbi:MAG: hypothetical protein ACRYGR_01925, partial [Janthinobacterium lividum]